ncbi:hypothetical protein E6O75_ATG10830 [Venturia nashicola]|uniref:Uncharacterized protein n=1 Tax=Venturia nashicola TaxID=86259 RepID=A0A4Z1PAH9_9PEZI|nr:hypothetical protein E6O75_ATG10830 [Venturia nashicola]
MSPSPISISPNTTPKAPSPISSRHKKEQTSFLSLSPELRQKILLNYYEHTSVIVTQDRKKKYLHPEQVRCYDEKGKLQTPNWAKARSQARVATQVLRSVDVRILDDVDYVVRRLREEVDLWLVEKGNGWREDLGSGVSWGWGLEDKIPDLVVSTRGLGGTGCVDGQDGSRWKELFGRCLGKLGFR